MPKIVDHDRRRIELVEATWRIIARLGLERATMREVAEEAGFANGALKPYFPTKDALVRATFEYVFARTNERVRTAAAGLGGLAALRAFCCEVLPLDATRIDEARIVLPFWHVAIHDPVKAGLNDRSMAVWRDWMTGWLQDARQAGEVRADVAIAPIVEALLTYLLGAQVTATLDPANAAPAQLRRQLDVQLTLLSA
ncbi:TetR/AcrR family transcriptional regulator [Arthrobacter sp. JSM 101049]|uniref:TetR/AcrR family transcriptional regulator n=1 Tax=Arthrobacter sp. JSM 101049 TaxID=929097 RepID=UPI00356AAAFA